MGMLIAAVNVLGFIGMASVGLIPVRVLRTISVGLMPRSNSTGGRLALAGYSAVAMVVLYIDVALVLRVFSCLNGGHCGPSRNSGWLAFASMGVWYVVFELAGAIATSIAKRAARFG